MRTIIIVLLLCPTILCAQRSCSPSDIPIGSTRDSVLSKLRTQGCSVKGNEPTSATEMQDDLVTPPSDAGGVYQYFELIFDKGKLLAVWSYTPFFDSAQKAFDVVFSELVLHSRAYAGKGGDLLGQRDFLGRVILQRPLSTGDPTIDFELPDGAVRLESKNKQSGVRVARVRNR